MLFRSETVESLHWPYVIRAGGGVLFVLGSLFMAYNVWRTVRGDKPVDLKDQPRVASAPELRHGLAVLPAE